MASKKKAKKAKKTEKTKKHPRDRKPARPRGKKIAQRKKAKKRTQPKLILGAPMTLRQFIAEQKLREPPRKKKRRRRVDGFLLPTEPANEPGSRFDALYDFFQGNPNFDDPRTVTDLNDAGWSVKRIAGPEDDEQQRRAKNEKSRFARRKKKAQTERSELPSGENDIVTAADVIRMAGLRSKKRGKKT